MKVRLRLNADLYAGFTVSDARTAVFNWLFRHHHHGHLVVRVDDVSFRTEGFEGEPEVVEPDPLALMTWLGLDWDAGPDAPGDDGPLRVSERLPIYQGWVDKLLESGRAYYCYFTAAEVEDMYIQQRIHGLKPRYEPRWSKIPAEEMTRRKEAGEWTAVRLKVPGHVVEINDIVRGKLVHNGPEHSDFVIMRAGKVPTRTFADVVDDHVMGITHVVRSESQKADNPFRAFVADALGIALPDYAHLPVLLAPDRTLLSERHGAVHVRTFREMGYMPEALTNYLCHHGWDPGESDTLRTLGSLARSFHIEAIQKEHSTWDTDALDAWNRMAVERIKDDALVDMLAPYVAQEGYDLLARGRGWARDLVVAVRPGLTCLSHVKEAIPTYFAEKVEPDPSCLAMLKSPEALKVLNAVEGLAKELPDVTRENYREVVDAARGAIPSRGKALVLCRVLLTGRETGSEFSKLLPLLGRDRILSRLDHMRRYLPRGKKE